MKNILIILLISLISYAAEKTVDPKKNLGTDGFTYEILEKDFLESIEEGIKEIELKEFEKAIRRDVIAHATGDNNLKKCIKSNKWKEIDYVELPEDVYSPSGRLYKKKGTKITSSISSPLAICFVDGSDISILKKQIEYFENATQGTCTYMVSKANVMDIRPLFPNNERIYPSKKLYEDRFSVKCHPTLIYLVNDEKITVELGEDAL